MPKPKNHQRQSSGAPSKKEVVEDRSLPQLQQALDPQVMSPAFEKFFSREYPDRKLKVVRFHVGKVNHKPGKECSIIYGVLCSGKGDDGLPLGNWFYGTMSANGAQHAETTANAPSTWPGCRFWRPVSYWPEFDMLLYAFPYDPELPHLGMLAELEFVKSKIQANLENLELAPEWQCRQIHGDLIKYMPGKRCVFRYDLMLTHPSGEQRQMTIFGKTYETAHSRYVFEVLRKIHGSPACTSGVLNIPRPVAHIDEANTLLQLAWEGENLSRLADQFGWANLPSTGLMPKIAAMLAGLHQIPITDLALKSGVSPVRLLENAYGDAADIHRHLPHYQEKLSDLVATLAATKPNASELKLQTTIHGTFKIAQILCRDDRLALVDFDSVALGDPHYDLAEFLASLVFLQISDNVPAAALGESVEQFLQAYQHAVPWVCDRRRIAWYLAAFLLGKIHSALKRLESEAGQNVAAAFALVNDWLKVAAG